MSDAALKQYLDAQRQIIDMKIDELCGDDSRWEGVPPNLRSSICYSLLSGGKRIRPILCIMAAKSAGLSQDKIMPLALAHEIIHTASLIHDDLPCMDDDDTRRGSPTNHKVYGEATAVLAGDAMLSWAVEIAAEGLPAQEVSAQNTLQSVLCLIKAIGPAGICGGQVLDMEATGAQQTADALWEIALRKTAALIESSVVSAALAAGAADIENYRAYGRHLGLAFQIVDDILDVISTKEELGKTPQKDIEQNKTTFVSVWGLEEAKNLAKITSQKAVDAMSKIDNDGTSLLIGLAKYLVQRTK